MDRKIVRRVQSAKNIWRVIYLDDIHDKPEELKEGIEVKYFDASRFLHKTTPRIPVQKVSGHCHGIQTH